MSAGSHDEIPTERERLEPLYEVREELQEVAGTDVPYAKYCERALELLDEAGYDVGEGA